MGPTYRPTWIPRLAANRSGLVSTLNLNEVNSRTLDQTVVLPTDGFEACARIFPVVNKKHGVGDNVQRYGRQRPLSDCT
jgi:hypothetical protein